MSFAQFFVACCLAIVLLAVSNTRAAVQGPPLCQSGIVEEMPPHIRKVCQALENSDQLTSGTGIALFGQDLSTSKMDSKCQAANHNPISGLNVGGHRGVHYP